MGVGGGRNLRAEFGGAGGDGEAALRRLDENQRTRHQQLVGQSIDDLS